MSNWRANKTSFVLTAASYHLHYHLSSTSCQISNGIINVMHFKPSRSHHTHIHVHGKIVFHKTGPWCQKDWGPLAYRVGESNGTPLQSSCLENPMDGGTWWAAVHRVAKSQTRLSDFTFTFTLPYPFPGYLTKLVCLLIH